MKRVIAVAFLGGLVACNSNTEQAEAPKNTDLITQNLKGKVETLEERTINFDSTGAMKGDSTLGTTSIDARGYTTHYIRKDSAGNITLDQTITRNPNGTVSEVKNMKDGKQLMRITIESDSAGNYTTAKTYDSTDTQDSYYTDLKSDEYGNVYAGKQYFMDGRIKATFDMKYEGPAFVGGVATDSTGKTSYQGTVTLNDKGDPASEHTTTLEKDSTVTRDITYKYENLDAQGNWTQRTTYDDKGKPTTVVKRTITYYKE